MTTETMTIHEALSELKMLDRRVQRKIDETKFCIANRHRNTKINGQTIDEYKADTAASYQSVRDLIRRRGAIRNALSKSNAVTTITVGGREYTVAEAIEMKKTGLELLKYLEMSMSNDYKRASSNVTDGNESLRAEADRYVQQMYGAKDKANSDDIERARSVYIEANTVDFIDPIGTRKELDALSEEIETFSHEVDSRISVSNAVTTITVTY